MLDAQKEIVKATLPAFRKHAEFITEVFYDELLSAHPELVPMFSTGDQENKVQARHLATSILAYVGNIDRLDLFGPAVTNISRRHVELGVLPEHYPIVGRHLLDAIRAALGETATPEVIDAWRAAYTQLADIMISREQEMYADLRLEGGSHSSSGS